MALQINLAGIATDSIVDGPGIRVVLFAQGCPRRCEGCHNPATHEFGTGTNLTVQQCYEQVKKNPIAKGVTLSGGEPFSQAEAFCALCEMLKPEKYEIAAYTGYTFEQLLSGTPQQKQLLSYLDVLIDGEFILAQKNLDLRFRGSENQRILNVPASLEKGKPVPLTQPRWVGNLLSEK